MTRRRGVERVPADHVRGEFPAGQVRSGALVAARYARGVALNLRDALEGHSLSGTCRDAELSRSTVQDLLGGRTWPDLVTVAKLEDVLVLTLWPGRGDAIVG